MATKYDVNDRLPQENRLVSLTYTDEYGKVRTRNAYMGRSYQNIGKDSYTIQWFFNPQFDFVSGANLADTEWSFLPGDEYKEWFALSSKDGSFLTFKDVSGGECLLVQAEVPAP
ncbi:hypothetical protein MA9V2_012 [Chryseobacterium phage MA9V-2]|nr:hypothetical protein MA9V2_012 [Chryseobacterium phage MA9V-2]